MTAATGPIRKRNQPHRRGERLRVAVLGYIVRGPMGGMSWHHLNYVAGLAALGHDVTFLEIGDQEPTCYDPRDHTMGTDPSFGLHYAAQAFARLDLGGAWGYYDAVENGWRGPLADRAAAVCAAADLVINVSGVNPLQPWFDRTPHRVLIDTDPTFTQIRHLTDPAAYAAAREHTAFFTFGENIPAGTASVPDDGIPWQPTRQPIALRHWPVTPAPRDGRYTTVMQWESYPPREYAGRRYGMKSQSFADFLDLPRLAGPVFNIALGGKDVPRDELEAKGWQFCAPHEVARDPWSYQDFIRGSKAEFGIAKHGYVASRCGWFSERSACYLATGRPVVAHDTGFGDWLRADRGVLRFSTVDEAKAAIEAVDGDYAAHCRAARDIAETYFAAEPVLGALIERTFADTAKARASAR
jgi:hypothetical protein